MRKYIDLHCDTLSRLFCEPALGNLFENNCQVDIKRLAADGCCAQIFACFVEKTDFSGISVWDDGYAYAGYLLDLFDVNGKYSFVILLTRFFVSSSP